VSSRPLPPQTLPFLLLQPVHPLVVHLPSFPPQQNVNPIVAIANPSFCQLPNPHPESGLVVPCRFLAVRRSEKQQHATTSPFAYPIPPFQISYPLLPPTRP
jgi:hypothetical protein